MMNESNEREYPSDLVSRMTVLLAETGAMTLGKRARKVLDGVFDYAEEAAAKISELADAIDATRPTEEARPAVPVECQTVIPLGSVQDTMRVLGTVPIHARLTLRTSVPPREHPGIRILSADEVDAYRPRIVATWEESR